MRTKTPQYAERILEAASRLFASRSFHEVRMEDVASEAAVSKGTLYRYFHDKDELYLALLKRASGQITHIMTERVASQSNAREQLVALMESVTTFFDEQPHLFQLIVRAEPHREVGNFPWQEARDLGHRLVFEIMSEGTRRGELDIREPNAAAMMLFGGIRAHIGYGKRPRPDGFIRSLVLDFLDGYDHRNRRS
ncbi:MAG: TetR/AcrR family transcriptional regulator [Gemmataceae bacterium]